MVSYLLTGLMYLLLTDLVIGLIDLLSTKGCLIFFLVLFEVAQDVQIYQHDYFESYNYYGLLRFMDKIVFGRLHRNYEFYSSRRTHIPIFRWSVADMRYEVATCQTYSDGKIVIFLSLSPIFLGVFPAQWGEFFTTFRSILRCRQAAAGYLTTSNR